MEEQEDVTKDDSRKLTVGDAWDSGHGDGEKQLSELFLGRQEAGGEGRRETCVQAGSQASGLGDWIDGGVRNQHVGCGGERAGWGLAFGLAGSAHPWDAQGASPTRPCPRPCISWNHSARPQVSSALECTLPERSDCPLSRISSYGAWHLGRWQQVLTVVSVSEWPTKCVQERGGEGKGEGPPCEKNRCQQS